MVLRAGRAVCSGGYSCVEDDSGPWAREEELGKSPQASFAADEVPSKTIHAQGSPLPPSGAGLPGLQESSGSLSDGCLLRISADGLASLGAIELPRQEDFPRLAAFCENPQGGRPGGSGALCFLSGARRYRLWSKGLFASSVYSGALFLVCLPLGWGRSAAPRRPAPASTAAAWTRAPSCLLAGVSGNIAGMDAWRDCSFSLSQMRKQA